MAKPAKTTVTAVQHATGKVGKNGNPQSLGGTGLGDAGTQQDCQDADFWEHKGENRFLAYQM